MVVGAIGRVVTSVRSLECGGGSLSAYSALTTRTSSCRRTATTRRTRLGQQFSRWSIRKLAACLRRVHGRVVRIGREALRCLLARRRAAAPPKEGSSTPSGNVQAGHHVSEGGRVTGLSGGEV